jgi:acid phosphatase family membrane protein YuiD
MNGGVIFGNKLADIVLVALISAQTLKVIFALFTERKLNFRRFLDTGSMPSSHTSSVVS